MPVDERKATDMPEDAPSTVGELIALLQTYEQTYGADQRIMIQARPSEPLRSVRYVSMHIGPTVVITGY